jgi:hypothetical protein
MYVRPRLAHVRLSRLRPDHLQALFSELQAKGLKRAPMYAYQVLHGLRCLLERQTRQGWSLSRMREQVLKVAATLRLHARRITVHLGAAADKWWPTLLKGLPKLTALS